MWQLYSLGSTFFTALGQSVDKATIVRQKSIGLLTATWIRIGMYSLIAYFAGFIILGEAPSLLLGPMIVLLGLTNAFNSYFYSVLLKRLEITTSGIFFNLAPIIFLFVDIVVLKRGLSIAEVSGIFLLVFGGILFLGRKKLVAKFGKEKRLAIFGMFLFNVFYIGFQNYLFQYYSSHYHISETNYLLSMALATFFFITIFIVLKSLLGQGESNSFRVCLRYAGGSFFSKIADYGSTFFFLMAIATASVSQVSAMQAFFPIMLMFLVLIIQGRMHIKMHEDLSKKALMHKIAGVVLISAGIFLVR
ncbi:MAG: hypothetical protein KBC17_02640 [Candidatus Pacebacteria bacterium]|nr:hypothetical protein [Candidatus Paceibacterota bacterium]